MFEKLPDLVMSNRVYFKSVNELKKLLKAKGCKILAIFPKGGRPKISFKRLPGIKESVTWTCANCECENKSKFENLKRTLVNDKKTQILCKSCAISKSKGGITFEKFVQILEKEEWKMISPKTDYEDTKTGMDVKCPNDHDRTINWNQFYTEGRRCSKCTKNDERRQKLERIRKEFEDKGFKLLATEYVDNATKMKCICKCGRENHITYSNFCRNVDGCKECTRRWTFVEAKDYISDQGCVLNQADDEEWTEFVLNSTKIAYTCVCGTEHTSTWKSFRKGCRCKKCTRLLIEQTCLEIYGYKNASKSPQVKAKIVATMVKRYGVEYAMQIEENVNKAYATNLKNHGGVHNLTLPGIREASKLAYEKIHGAKFGQVAEHQKKGREATKKSLGVEFPFQSKEIHDKIKKGNFVKYGSEHFLTSDAGKSMMIDLYGAECFFHTKAYKEIMIELYGVEHAAQNSEILSRMQSSAFSTKPFIFPSGNEVKVQGYEPFALLDLLDNGIEEKDIIVGTKNVPVIDYEFEGVSRKYFPDIYIPSKHLLIEVKSMYTFEKEHAKNVKKFQAASKEYNFELWIYDAKGVRIVRQEYFDSVLNFIRD